MKYKINDEVKIISFPKWKGRIWDCWINKAENIQTEDGECVYVVQVTKPGRQPHMVVTHDFKESELL